MSKATRPLLLLRRRPLLLILLLLCCASVCVAWDDVKQRFVFEEMINKTGRHSAGVVREVPRKGQSGVQAYTVATSKRKLIRIVTSMKDLEDGTKYCVNEGDHVTDFSGYVWICDKKTILNKDRKTNLMEKIIPTAVKLHADRLLVDRESEPLVIPPFESGACSLLTVPETHRTKGVPNADMVLYVAARPGGPLGAYCASLSSGRPIAGLLNFVPYPSVSPRLSVRHAAHHIGHALGFEYELMKKLKMTSTITVRGVQREVVSSEMTKKKAREHYGCDNLKGMELDYKSSLKHVASLWSWRNAKDELMNSANAVAGGYYTALTMATFHDMKFYSANWGMEEPMSWGHKAGCGFIEGSCLKDESVSNYPNAFCTGKRVYCSTDHFALSKCDDTPDINTDPKSPCPILLSPVEVSSSGHFRSSACTELGNSGFPDFLTGENSMCLSTDDYDIKEGVVPLKMSGVCALVSCDESHRKVQVKYKGNDRWHDCPEGKKITVETSASLSFKTITCPQYTEVCTIAFNGSSRLTVNDPSGHPTPPSGGANGGGGGNNNVGGDGCATVAPIALAAVVLMVITPML